MSHFVVLVVGNNVEKQLAPYHEFECTGEDNEYVQEVDITNEVKRDYEHFVKEEETSLAEFASRDYGYNIVMDRKDIDTEDKHKYGYILVHGNNTYVIKRTNPNKKWDWYMIGGRWTGYFKLKEGRHGETGTPGLMTSNAKEGWVDQARKGDIDFEAMRKKEEEKAAEFFDNFADIFEEYELPTCWKKILEKHGTENIEMARNEYYSQPWVKAVQQRAKERKIFSFKLGPEKFCNGDRSAFIARARLTAISTFAVVMDGKWYEKGEMSWFGIVHDEKKTKDWVEEFNKFLDSISDDTLLTIVDCHI